MENLIIEKLENIAIARINRPAVLNALNTAILKELHEFLTDIPNGIEALILTGTGNKAFIVGADIKEMRQMNSLEILQFSKLGQEVANALEQSPLLTIAAINGYALGGGFEMALACDFLFASQTAQFGFPELTLGCIPGFGGTQRIMRSVGIHFAKELIFTSRRISAQEAYHLRLINRLCEEDRLLSDVVEEVREILRFSHTAIIHAKQAVNASALLGQQVALELEANLFASCFSTKECIEAMKAFGKEQA